ncbi:LptF/LptG family permease, partial [Candidatus Dependentiae bacterium]|nr:LptF/LptG family permease [Candidatus Dependentiae bacterium]
IGYSGVIIRIFKKDQKGIEIERMSSGPINFFLRPEDLARVKIEAENLNFFQLRKKIQELQKSGENVTKLLVELNLKISYPFTNVIIALIAIPFGANVTKRGLAKGFGIGLIIVIIFLTLVKFGITLGSGGALPPVLSAWIANIIFAVIGVYLFQKAKM